MSVHRTAALRRARIRELLHARTQDQPILEAPEVLELLGDPSLNLRTVERDLQIIRMCRPATVLLRRHLTNRTTMVSNTRMAKSKQSIDDLRALCESMQKRVAELEANQRALLELLERLAFDSSHQGALIGELRRLRASDELSRRRAEYLQQHCIEQDDGEAHARH